MFYSAPCSPASLIHMFL